MTHTHIKKWDRSAAGQDAAGLGMEKRYGHLKRALFSKARGNILLVAAGTGHDFPSLPAGARVTAVDFSSEMLRYAARRALKSPARIQLTRGDIQRLPFRDGAFDTVLTSCTFCSVPDPVEGLVELRRVLKGDGALLMFEHVRAGNPLLGLIMDVMTPLSRKFGPDINRRTGDNVLKAGFKILREYNVYLDIVKMYECAKE